MNYSAMAKIAKFCNNSLKINKPFLGAMQEGFMVVFEAETYKNP